MRHKGRWARFTLPLVVAVVAMLAVLITTVAHPLSSEHRPASSFATHPPASSNHLLPALAAHRPPSSLPNRPTADRSEPSTQAQTVSVEGARRTYRAIVPLHVTNRLPLLVVLHGRGQSGSLVASQTGFLDLVEQRRAILVAPDGEQHSWNAGHAAAGSPAHAVSRMYPS